MKFFLDGKHIVLRLYNRSPLRPDKYFRPRRLLPVNAYRLYSSSPSSPPTGGVSASLLDNPGVRSYLDNLMSNDYSDTMSKHNVASLITAVRSLRADLQSLNEFDTGQYDEYVQSPINTYSIST